MPAETSAWPHPALPGLASGRRSIGPGHRKESRKPMSLLLFGEPAPFVQDALQYGSVNYHPDSRGAVERETLFISIHVVWSTVTASRCPKCPGKWGGAGKRY